MKMPENLVHRAIVDMLLAINPKLLNQVTSYSFERSRSGELLLKLEIVLIEPEEWAAVPKTGIITVHGSPADEELDEFSSRWREEHNKDFFQHAD